MSEFQGISEVLVLCLFNFPAIAEIVKEKVFGVRGSLDSGDILRAIEYTIPEKYDPDFRLTILSDSEWEDGESEEGIYEEHSGIRTVKIREDIYDKAAKGDRYAVSVICHEISHWILQELLLFKIFYARFSLLPSEPAIRRVLEDMTELMTWYLMSRDGEFTDGSCVLENQNSGKEQDIKDFASFYHEFSRRFNYALPLETVLLNQLNKKSSFTTGIAKSSS